MLRTLSTVLLSGLATFALAGCLATHPPVRASSMQQLSPEAFFEGTTHGLGVLRIRTRSPQLVQVTSLGTHQPDGSFRLVQTIKRGENDPYTRTWTMTRTGSETFDSSLTEADGPVELAVDGNTLSVRYRMESGAAMHQRLVLQPDRRTVLNLATVRWLGIPIARLTETIRRPTPVHQ